MSYAEEDYNYLDIELSRATDRIEALSAEVERLKADGRLLINDCDCIGMKSPMLENFRQALGAKP